MKLYTVKIGYEVIINMWAKNKKEVEERAWFNFDQLQPHEPKIKIKEIK